MNVSKRDFAASLSLLKGIIPTKANVPALESVMVKGDKLIAYNLTTGLIVPLDVQMGLEEETFLLPSKAIETIHSMPEGDIEIKELEGNKLEIRMKRIVHNIQTYPVSDYPAIAGMEKESQIIEVNESKLSASLTRVKYALSGTVQNPALQGLLFDVLPDNETINLVSTDGYRMALCSLKCKSQNAFRFILPKDVVTQLGRLLDGNETIRIFYDGKYVMFSCKRFQLFSQSIEGNYMDYQQFFKGYEAKKRFAMEKKRFAEAVLRGQASLCRENEQRVKLEFNQENILLKTASSLGNYVEEIPVTVGPKEGLNISFNVRYLLEGLKSVPGDTMELYVSKKTEPILIISEDYKGLLLPTRDAA